MMAAMARNAVLVLVLVGVVLQLCSVVPPVAAAGRALSEGTTLANGGIGGTLEAFCAKGGGGAGPGTLTVINGALYCYNGKQYASLTVFGHTVTESVPHLPLLEGIPIANGGMGGALVQDASGICANGGGGAGPWTLTFFEGAVYCYKKKQYVRVTITGVTVSRSTTELPAVAP